MEILTYDKLVQDYTYHLAMIFRSNNPQELSESFKELYAFKNLIEDTHIMSKVPEIAKNIEPKVIESNILPKLLNNLNSTFDMLYDETPFKQVLGKMHDELDEYKKLVENHDQD